MTWHEVAIWIPSYDRHGAPVDWENELTRIEAELTRLYGGCTTTDANGSWNNGERDICEPVRVVSSYAHGERESIESQLSRIADELRTNLGQTCVMWSMDSVPRFLECIV